MIIEKIKQEAVKAFAALYDTGGRHLTPAAVLTINGKSFGTQAMSRIISIEMTDKRGFESDELTITLDDHDGALSIPNIGDKITLHLGYKETGLVDKGEYLFSEFTASGAPDTLSITARAADLAESLAEQQERSWHRQTLYQIVETIAKRHGYRYRIADVYKSEQIAHIDQTSESDAAFLTRLAEQYDAIATVKHGIMLFLPAGEATTASGEPMPAMEITRGMGDNHSFTFSATGAFEAVRAYYTDKATGQKKEVVVTAENLKAEKKTITQTKQYKRPRKDKKTGRKITSKTTTKTVTVNRKVNTDGKKIKTLRHLYISERTAWNGARAAFRRLQRGAAQFSINLAAGRPDMTPETPVTVRGFKPEIDSEKWLITEVAHKLDDSGYTCALSLEALIDLQSAEDDKE